MASNHEPPSLSQRKKLERKLTKLRHILKKETDLVSAPFPTKNIAICNSGLVNGLTEEIVFQHFSKYGALSDIVMLPGKSCCFVAFDNEQSSVAAYTAFNGKLNIAQDNRPVYLLYVEQLPSLERAIWNELPPGLTLIDDFVNVTEEHLLLNLCEPNDGASGMMKHRLVKHFGFEFRYDINNVDKDKPLNKPIPEETNFLWQRLTGQQPKFKDFIPNQLTVNHYSPGQGIPHHVDTHSAFEDSIICLSLGSPIVMEFKQKDKHVHILLPQRSLLIMSEESRYNWTHGIVPRKYDIVKNQHRFTCLKRGTRVSFTFRKVLQGECRCHYKEKCDSFKENTEIKDDLASQLEALHVHEVYENIADHFSDTRHTPWPNVFEFVKSFDHGDVLVDVGCGNGKYLGNNGNIYDIGCDRSAGLMDICREKNFETFLADCLSIPIKDSFADGVISIAVIHHLANEHRRLRALEEIIRILRPGGEALIYVWAHDQLKNQKKSSYIMQDRKNRKSNKVEENVISEASSKTVPLPAGNVSLPVHTNRSNFKANDILVPWKLKDEHKMTFLRFYHVFEENELEKLCQKIAQIQIVKSYYDQGNWCVLLRKLEK